MNQAPTKVKKEIYNIKEIRFNRVRLAKLEFVTKNKGKFKCCMFNKPDVNLLKFYKSDPK